MHILYRNQKYFFKYTTYTHIYEGQDLLVATVVTNFPPVETWGQSLVYSITGGSWYITGYEGKEVCCTKVQYVFLFSYSYGWLYR